MLMSSSIYKRGTNAYALYPSGTGWRESASVRNADLVSVQNVMIGISGIKNHGKTTFMHELNIAFGDAKFNLNFGDWPKILMCNIFPLWTLEHFEDRELKEKVCPHYGVSPREAITKFATGFMRNQINPKHWINHIDERLQQTNTPYNRVIIGDVRFDNEAEYIKSKGGIIIDVRNHNKPIFPEDETESGISAELIDVFIDNSKEDLNLLKLQAKGITSLYVKRGKDVAS